MERTEQENKLGKLAISFPDFVRFNESMRSGDKGQIGVAYMPGAIAQVEAEAFGGSSNFNLEARLYPASGTTTKQIQEVILSRYSKVTDKVNNTIIEGKYSGTKFVLNNRVFSDTKVTFLRIATSWGYDINNNSIRLTDAPSVEDDEMRLTCQDFIQLLYDAVVLTNAKANLPTPTERLELRAPKIKKKDVTSSDLYGKIQVERPTISFDEIGGQQQAKKEIMGLSYAIKNPDLYEKWGTTPPKGILLYGPPGTGKTLLARALASQASAQFFHVEASDIMTKWFGESERILKGVFELAEKTDEPTILFFDEIDAIAPKRSEMSGSGGDLAAYRVLSTLLENLDGLNSNKNVMVVASTNQKNGIDRALLRPGRLNVHVEVPLPDGEGREEIFKVHMEKTSAIAQRKLFEAIDFDMLVKYSEKFSGADIEEIIRRTLEEKVRMEGSGKPVLGYVLTEELLLQMEQYEHVISHAGETIIFN